MKLLYQMGHYFLHIQYVEISSRFFVPSIEEVVTHFYCDLLYKMGHYFLHIQYHGSHYDGFTYSLSVSIDLLVLARYVVE